MSRRSALIVVIAALTVSPCFGQEWAQKMFKDTDHDFGSVARGAKTEYRFVFENIYMEDVHIANVYASCSCTSVRVENPTLKTYEKGAIVAHFNTDAFYGQKGATITVVIDKPYPAEVQLHDRGYVRSDVEVLPGSVQIGSIDQGAGAEQSVAVKFSGSGQWQITGVRSSNPHISAEVVETSRDYGQVSYALKVRVDKNAPSGYLDDRLMLATNDQNGSQVPVQVEGRVMPGIMVSPTALFMGVVQPGQKVTKQLVVKGKKPFRILSIDCDDKSFKFDTSKEKDAKELHLVPVTFLAGTDEGKVVKTIKIKTDQGEMTPELAAYAVVAAAQ
jgi:hypothetical protein